MARHTIIDAKDATAAQAYTFQLYTALGVGLSSTSVRRPMMGFGQSRTVSFPMAFRARWVVDRRYLLERRDMELSCWLKDYQQVDLERDLEFPVGRVAI